VNLFEIDFRSLEPESIGSWPPILKWILLLIIFISTLLIGYLYDIKDLVSTYQTDIENINTLKDRYEDSHNKAANLDAYTEQMKQIQLTFDTLKKQLPKKIGDTSDDAALLEEISQQSDLSNLDFRYMKPGTPAEKGFYIEYPIELSFSGTYHNIAKFISNISSMPRIITLHNFSLRSENTPPNTANSEENTENKGRSKNLEMNLQAKTYWTTNKPG